MDLSQIFTSSTSSPASQAVLQSLPRHNAWGDNLCLYKGSWLFPAFFEGTWLSENKFHAKDGDILLATLPKAGTIWLKSIVFATINRVQYPIFDPNHPLQTANAHDLVPFVEFIYMESENPDFSCLLSPRLFATHNAYNLLPETVKATNTRIIYLCRDQKDSFISMWHFLNKVSLQGNTEGKGQTIPLEEAFELYCNGITTYGPSWDHLLGYWNASFKEPGKVLFLKYEDLKGDIVSQVKKIAEFLGFPFSSKEESKGVVEEIARMCSFECLSNLKVNGSDGKRHYPMVDNTVFFRKGESGDWANYITPSMAEKLDRIMEQKLKGSGLDLD